MLDDLKANNARWASESTAGQPDFFRRLVGPQHPPYLWIGCADSRVPANEIVGLGPGELFVHRNVANLANPADPSWLAVLQYAVEALKVEHVLVVGHTGCGGVAASIDGQRHGFVDHWLAPIRDTAHAHHDELQDLPEGAERVNRLVELNVRRQVRNVATDVIVQDAWAQGQALSVHGWVYALEDGKVRDLGVTTSSPADAAKL